MNSGEDRAFGNLPVSTIMLLVNLLVLIVGIGIVWGTQVSRIDDLKDRISVISARLDNHDKMLNEDRQTLSNRLTGLESDTRYISQTLNELKLRFK